FGPPAHDEERCALVFVFQRLQNVRRRLEARANVEHECDIGPLGVALGYLPVRYRHLPCLPQQPDQGDRQRPPHRFEAYPTAPLLGGDHAPAAKRRPSSEAKGCGASPGPACEAKNWLTAPGSRRTIAIYRRYI